MEKVYMQITSGRGPAECCRVVALVLEKILKQAVAKGVKTEIVERENGTSQPYPALSRHLSARRRLSCAD